MAKKKWGDRKDGIWLKDIPAMNRIMPPLMPNRADNEAHISVDIDIRPIETYLEKLNRGRGIICCGQGAWEMPETSRRLRQLFEEKGINIWVDFWGFDVNHDWPWWHKQVAYFVPKLLEN